MSKEDALPPVLTASVHDVRYFAALLRGVNFVNRSTVLVSENGLTITVEEARTLVGMAFIFSDIFDEYAFHPERPPPPNVREQPPRATKKVRSKGNHKQTSSDVSETESEAEGDSVAKDGDWRNSAEDPSQRRSRAAREGDDADDLEEPSNVAFEVPLNTLIECLNIFGTAGPSSGAAAVSASGVVGRGGHGWRRANENDDGSDIDDGGGRRGGLDAYFAAAAAVAGGGQEKRTSMRMSYFGPGYPLTLIIAEDASGPTTTCEITTFDSEPHLELDFDNSKIVLKIILKSSWLRDALSELDPSCEQLTFIGNPPIGPGHMAVNTGGADANQDQRSHQKNGLPSRPMLRIQATGTFGSTEMDYPNDREVLETFECTRNVSFSYRFGHILRTLRALQSSTKTSLRIDEDGLLSLQFLMPSPKPKHVPGASKDAFIEFRCLALDEDY